MERKMKICYKLGKEFTELCPNMLA